MKRHIILIGLIFAAMISLAANRTGTINAGRTVMTPALSFSASDSIITSATYTITVTAFQQYPSKQNFYTTITDVDGGSPSVAITAYGKCFAGDAWTQIGSPVTWTSSSNNPVNISATTPNQYNYYKLAYVASGAEQHVKVTAFDLKLWYTSGLASSGTLTDGTATINSGAISGLTTVTLANGLTIDNAVNNVLEFNENSDELKLTFGSNTVTTSSGDVTAYNFGGGISSTWGGSTSGGIKIAPIATGTAIATLQNQNVSASTITLPSATCTLPGLGLANTWTANQTLTGTSYVELDGAVSGGIKILPIATGTALTTISNQNVSAATITLPSATCTLPGLGLANTFSGVNSFTGGLMLSTNSTVNWAKGGAITVATTGTDVAATDGGRFWVELEIPYNITVTGLAYLVGSVGGTDSVVVQLCNSAGVEVATSREVGGAADLVGTAAQFQSVAFTTPYSAVAGKYFAVIQFNGVTAKFRAYAIPGMKFIANTAVGTWQTAAGISPGSSFVADKGPILMTY